MVIAGTKGADFMAWNTTSRHPVTCVTCGGAKRAAAFQLTSNSGHGLAYCKGKQIFVKT